MLTIDTVLKPKPFLSHLCISRLNSEFLTFHEFSLFKVVSSCSYTNLFSVSYMQHSSSGLELAGLSWWIGF